MIGRKLSVGALAAVLVATGIGTSENPLASPAQATEKSCRTIGSGFAAYVSDENAACLGYQKYRGETSAASHDRDLACRSAKGNLASVMFSRGLDGDCQCTSKPNPPFGGLKWTCKIGYFYMAAEPKRPSDQPIGNGNAVR